ncbi:unnamed protein product [Thelazia callipaeda]|uniref:Uncharacterized protein n=1 Tax=Thelazia callipaeda TaxID=103827 RepID=A0A0N5D5L2_THECL|nr:unnamed protein product [Thelazia callipaeda]
MGDIVRRLSYIMRRVSTSRRSQSSVKHKRLREENEAEIGSNNSAKIRAEEEKSESIQMRVINYYTKEARMYNSWSSRRPKHDEINGDRCFVMNVPYSYATSAKR